MAAGKSADSEEITGGVSMAKVVMYSTAFCPYCIMAERLLLARGVTEIEKIRVDLEPAMRAEMMAKTGRRTYNESDGIFREAGDQLTLQVVAAEKDEEGYVATFDRTNPSVHPVEG